MEDHDEMAEPFWLQTADGHRRLRRRRQLSSIFLNSGLLLTLLLLIACLLIFLIIPSFLSFTSQMLRPHSVKKSWDSLNLVLVIFAIVCGFLSRSGVQRSNTGSYEPAASAARSTAVSRTSYYEDDRRFQQSAAAEKVSLPQRRFGDYQDRLSHSAGGGGGMSRLRSFNSYPDLRQESLWSGADSGVRDDRWRFYDDTHVRDYSYRFGSPSDEILRRRELAKEEEMPVDEVKENENEKEIAVDTVTLAKEEEEVMAAASDPPPPLLSMDLMSPPPSSPPLPPPGKVAKRKVQRTYRSVGQSRSSDGWEEREMDIEDFYKRPAAAASTSSPPQKAVSRRRGKRHLNRQEFVETIREEQEEEKKTVVEEIKYVYLPPPSPPPPPPPPPPEKKKAKDFLISLRRKKKKKQRQHSVENLASLFDPESEFPQTELQQSSIPPPSPLPPPPPPPPPPHFFQNLFSPRRGGKSKKVHSLSLAPTPPPHVPLRRADSSELHLSRSVRRSMDDPSVSRAKSERAPATAYRISNREEIGNASPSIPIPPPPPPPPFKMPAWKFEVRGDYVRVASFNSSRSGSPDLESEDPSDRESSPIAGAAAAAGSPLFCPSPDVDTKADNFIARFRAGLKMEKVKSNLGPGEGPN